MASLPEHTSAFAFAPRLHGEGNLRKGDLFPLPNLCLLQMSRQTGMPRHLSLLPQGRAQPQKRVPVPFPGQGALGLRGA